MVSLPSQSNFRERYDGIIQPSTPTQFFGLGLRCGCYQPIECHINALRLDAHVTHLCLRRQRQVNESRGYPRCMLIRSISGALNVWTYREKPSSRLVLQFSIRRRKGHCPGAGRNGVIWWIQSDDGVYEPRLLHPLYIVCTSSSS